MIVTTADFANLSLLRPSGSLQRALESAAVVPSVLEPLGTAMLGASPGQVLECSPDDGSRAVRLVGIVYQPERELRARLFVANCIPEWKSV